MRRLVIGSRNRVLDTTDTYFVSGADLIRNFPAYLEQIAAADFFVWSWYAVDANLHADLEATLRGTEAILDELSEWDLPGVFLSTDAVFAGRDGEYRETDTPDPNTPYGRIKLAQESLMTDFLRLRFTTFGPSYNPDRPLLLEMIAQGVLTTARTRQFFSPISTVSLNSAIDGLIAQQAAPSLYHLTSQRINKQECCALIANAIGTPIATGVADETPLDLSLSSATHIYSLTDEIARASSEWTRLRGLNIALDAR